MAELIFDESAHKYYIGNVELPSVTDIIRFCGYDRAAKATRGSDPFYRERGAKVHELCFLHDTDGAEHLQIPFGYEGYIQAYSSFRRDYNVRDWLFMELPMGDADLGFAGTPDRVGYIDDCLTIVDLKTGALDPVALSAQLTGYSQIVRKLLNARSITRLIGVQLNKKGEYMAKEVKYDPDLFGACQILFDRCGGSK